MALTTSPLIAWGTADDLSTYTQVGTCSVTTGQTDPFGGTTACSLNDTDVANTAYRKKTVAFTTSGAQVLLSCAKGGTSTRSLIEIIGAGNRGGLQMDWSGGVPTFSAINGATLVGSFAMGSSWYAAIWQTASSLVKTDTNEINYEPASTNAAATGTAIFCVRNVVLTDLVDTPVSWSQPKPGYLAAEGPSGTQDSWSYGTNRYMGGNLTNIPPNPTASPILMSGWYGENEAASVNCGIDTMLRAGWDKQSLVWVPDRTVCSTNQTGYMMAPDPSYRPEPLPNGNRKVPFSLVGSSVFTGF
jgi:hypothetical protein